MDSRCPRKLKCLPTMPCQEGLKAVRCARDGKEGGCPFFVNDPGSAYCFFKYMADNAGTPTPDDKIARLLMINDAEVKKIVSNFKRRSANKEEFRD
jgi:hypothetical protein